MRTGWSLPAKGIGVVLTVVLAGCSYSDALLDSAPSTLGSRSQHRPNPQSSRRVPAHNWLLFRSIKRVPLVPNSTAQPEIRLNHTLPLYSQPHRSAGLPREKAIRLS